MASRNPTSMQRYSQRYNPITEVMTLHDAMDRLLADSFVRPFGFNDMTRTLDTTMPVDMYEENDKLIVKTPMPGVRAEDVNISIEDNVLTITGEIRSEENRPSGGEQTRQQAQAKGQQQGQAQGQQQGGDQNANRNWYLREQQYARFVRAVTLPFPVQADKAEATMQDGVLTLELPKAEEAKQKKIQVKPK